MKFQAKRGKIFYLQPFDVYKAMVGWFLAWRIDRLKKITPDRKEIIFTFFAGFNQEHNQSILNTICRLNNPWILLEKQKVVT